MEESLLWNRFRAGSELVEMWTDGASSGNPGSAGIGIF
jgi:hypothetical protein